MPLYNGNVNIIEGGNSLLQLYNFPPSITFVTTGSNRVIFKTKQNVFCGGLELQWSKDATFDSGSTTTYSASIACTSSLATTLLPLANITGAYAQFIGYDDLSTPDDGVWYLRLRGENEVILNPTYTPSSSFSETVLVNTNNKFSCGTDATYIYSQNNILLADTYNSSSVVWQAATGSLTASVVPGGSPGFETYPYIQRSGSDTPQSASLGLNKDTIAMNGAGFSYYRGPALSGSNPQTETPGVLFVERGKVQWDMGRWNLIITIGSGSEGDSIVTFPSAQNISGDFKNKAIYCVPVNPPVGSNQNISVTVDGVEQGTIVISINDPVPSVLTLDDISATNNSRIQLWKVNGGSQEELIDGYNCIYLTDN